MHRSIVDVRKKEMWFTTDQLQQQRQQEDAEQQCQQQRQNGHGNARVHTQDLRGGGPGAGESTAATNTVEGTSTGPSDQQREYKLIV